MKTLNTGDILPDGSAPIPDGLVPFHEHGLVPVLRTANTTSNKSTVAPTSNKSTTEPPLSQGKKCLDAAGEAVWCSSSTAIVEQDGSYRASDASDAIVAKHHNESTAAHTSNTSTPEPPLLQGKKCLDAAGKAVWCSSSTAIGDSASDASEAIVASSESIKSAKELEKSAKEMEKSTKELEESLEKKCLDANGEAVWCSSA